MTRLGGLLPFGPRLNPRKVIFRVAGYLVFSQIGIFNFKDLFGTFWAELGDFFGHTDFNSQYFSQHLGLFGLSYLVILGGHNLSPDSSNMYRVSPC